MSAVSTKLLRGVLVWFIFAIAVAVVFFLGIMQGINSDLRSFYLVEGEALSSSANNSLGDNLRLSLAGLVVRTASRKTTALGANDVEAPGAGINRWLARRQYKNTTRRLKKPRSPIGPAAYENTSDIQISRSVRNYAVQSICQAERVNNVSMLDPSTRAQLARQMIVDDQRKFLYCYVPKVACSNWKRVIKFMQGSIDDIGAKMKMDHQNGLVFLDSFSDEEISYRLQNYYKFVFVRNPMERLLSAFRNKFGDENDVYRRRYAPGIIRRYRGSWDGKSRNITFEEFLRFLLDTRTSKMDPHWKPMHLLCRPCAVQYDFVGSFEHLAADADYVLDKIKGNTGAYFPARQTWYKPTTEDTVETLISRVDPIYVQRIVDKYILDFITFGYAPPQQYYLKLVGLEPDGFQPSNNDIDMRLSELS